MIKRTGVTVLLILYLVCLGHSQSGIFKNDRLKMSTYKDTPMGGHASYRSVDGIWVSEAKDPSKALVFPQQVSITCHNYEDDKNCIEISVTLTAAVGMVAVDEIASNEYEIQSWDAHGLVAKYGGDEGTSRCQLHVLTMNFESGAVSVSDIPTHKKGCEAFQETNSYRLVRGSYWVDTSPNNDLDKPRNAEKKK